MQQMDEKNFFSENRLSVLFTVFMLSLGTVGAYSQGYFALSKPKVDPRTFSELQLKVVFDGDDPELLGYVPAPLLSKYPALMGDSAPDDESVVLGYEEAREMMSESNITLSEALWGYKTELLGSSITVSGVLKKTDSLLDMMHLLSSNRFGKFSPGEKISVELTEDKMPKFFYGIKPDNSNWPAKARFASGSEDAFKSQVVESSLLSFDVGNGNVREISVHVGQNKTYVPLVLGSEEARMMRDEKLFQNVGDKIDGFFGRNVYIEGILEPTDTVLDMFHYIPAE